MMVNAPNNDAAAVYALLSTVSDVEGAKAALKDIKDATEAYTQLVESSRTELQKANDDLAVRKAAVDADLLETTRIRNDFNSTYEVRTKQLADAEAALAIRQSTVENNEVNQTATDRDLSSRENALKHREDVISNREIAIKKISDEADALKNEYTTKIQALKSIISMPTNYTMNADGGTLGGTFGTFGAN